MARTGDTRLRYVTRTSSNLIPFNSKFCYNAPRFEMGFEPVFYFAGLIYGCGEAGRDDSKWLGL